MYRRNPLISKRHRKAWGSSTRTGNHRIGHTIIGHVRGPGHNAPALLLASFTRVCEEGINATHGHDGKEAYVPLNEPSGGTVAYIP